MTMNRKGKLVYLSIITALALVMSFSCGGDKKHNQDDQESDKDAGVEECDGYLESAYCIDGELVRPTIGVRSVSVLDADGEEFKDCNDNGELDPYEDWRLSPTERATDLVGKMSLEQKIGLLWEGGLSVTPSGEDGKLSFAGE